MVGAGVLVIVGVAVVVAVAVAVGVLLGVTGVAVNVAVPVGVGVNATQFPAEHEALNTTVQNGPHDPFTGAPQDGKGPQRQQSLAPGVFVGVGVLVAVGDGVAVGVGEGVIVGVGVLVKVGVKVAVAVNVAVGVAVAVGVGVLVGVNVAVSVGVWVGVLVGVGVMVGVFVGVGVVVGVGVSVGVKVVQAAPPHTALGIGVQMPQTPGVCCRKQAPWQSQQTLCASAVAIAKTRITSRSPAHVTASPPHREIFICCNQFDWLFVASDGWLLSPTCVDLFVDLK